MKRLMKQANSIEEIIDIAKAILDNSECTSIIIDYVENWLEYNLESIDDLDEKYIYEKFFKEMDNNPDELLEKVIDLVPEEGDDDKLYNAEYNTKHIIIEMLLEQNYNSIMRAIARAINDEELIRSENK